LDLFRVILFAQPEKLKISVSTHPGGAHVAFDNIEVDFFVGGDYDRTAGSGFFI